MLMKLLPFTLFMAGLIAFNVAFYFWALIAGLIVTGLSLIFVGLLFGQAIQEVNKLKGDQ